MEKNTIKRYSLSKQVADKLEKMIENHIYKVDEKIPTEADLMKKFDVSRNTIRESVQSLVSAGILEVRQGDGTYVRSNNRFDAGMQRILKGTKYQDINETRKTLEISIAFLAALRRTEEDLDRIKEALIERQRQDTNEREHTILDIKFHMEIAKSCGNILLVTLYKSLYSYLIENISKRTVKTSLTNEQIDQLHIDLYEAIAESDGEKAKDVARKILSI